MRKFFSKFYLTQKFILVMLVCALLPSVIVVIGLIWSSNNTVDSQLPDSLEALACSQARHLETPVEIIENLHKQIRDNPSWINLFTSDSIKSEEAVIVLSNLLENSYFHDEVGVAFYKANSPVKTLGNPDINFDPDWLEEISQISIGGELTWRSKNAQIYAAQTIPTNSQVDSVNIIIGFPAKLFDFRFDTLPDDFDYYIIDSNDKVVFSRDSKSRLPSNSTSLEQDNSDIKYSSQDIVSVCINNKTWHVIITKATNILNSTGGINYFHILACLIALPLIGFFTWFIIKHYLKPIRSITNGLQAIRSNQLESLKPLDAKGFNDEIGDLIQGYNSYLDVAKSEGQRESALRQSEERFGLAIRGANDGIWDWDINKNFCYYSPRWRYMLGYTEESVRNTPSEWFTRVHPDDLDELKADMNAHLDGNSRHFENEHRLRHMNGSYIWVVARGLALRDSNGKAYRFAGSIGDISKRKAFEGRLLKDAMHDPLTNLPNQAYFKEVLNHALSRMYRREDYYAAVLIIDLDHFKNINDKLGYETGDQLLKEISVRLLRSIRTLDTIARYNGDEFSILLEEISGLHDAIRITQRIQKDLSQPIIIDNQKISANASIGIVILTRAYQDALEILRDADTAMFQAKANGRGRFEIFDKEMHTYSLSKLRMEDEIQHAIKNEQFQIFFQPVVESITGETIYVEALLRWKHPDKGLIGTDVFIPLAEESGQISILDKWMLKNACRKARNWIDNGFDQLRLSVNISPRMLMDPDLPEIIRSSLADTGILNYMLVIEITESTGIYNSGIAIQNLFELTSLGIEICLDDYGLVASSLEQLKRLPVSTIKIAQSFIKDLPSNINDAAITEAIINMAHILGMKVVCPGIENISQMNFVKENGCDYLQGYLFAKPMDQTEFIRLLTEEGTNFLRFFNENPELNQ